MSESGREYDYQQLRIPKYLRTALKKYRDETEGINTLSEAIIDILPDDIELNKMEINEDQFVLISVDDEAHTKVHGLAGDNVTSYTAIERFFREKAVENDLENLVEILDKKAREE